MTVESDNAKEKIMEMIDKCIKCGLCKADCPVFNILREETYSGRGKILILEEGVYDRIFYECSLCGKCEENCPVKIKLTDVFRKARVVLTETGKAGKEVHIILKNILESGNIYGE